MKKILLIFVMAITLVFTSACTDDKQMDSKTDKENKQTESEEKNSEKADKDKESEKESDETESENQNVNNDYYNAKLLDGVEEYVELLDPKNSPTFANYNLQYREEIPDEFNTNLFTGECKQYFISSDEKPSGNDEEIQFRVRIPHIKGDSELITELNAKISEAIQKAYADAPIDQLYYTELDYDAYIYEDILSIKMTEDHIFKDTMEGGGKSTIASFNLDVSSGEIQAISQEDLLNKLDLDTNLIKEFIPEYMDACMSHFLYNIAGENDMELYYDGVESSVQEAIAKFEQDLNNKSLLIYKNAHNDYFNLDLGKYYNPSSAIATNPQLTLAKTKLGMAILSAPEDAVGVIYKDYDSMENQDIPVTGTYGVNTKLHKLNDETNGIPVYITTLCLKNGKIGITDYDEEPVLLMNEFDEQVDIFVKKLKDIALNIPETKNQDIYLYYTSLPETIPFETVYASGISCNLLYNETLNSFGDNEIYDDMKDGYKLQYIYSDTYYGDYATNEYSVEEEGKPIVELTLNQDRTFTASGEWDKVDMKFTKGKYTTSPNYIYIFPSEEDLQKGASEFYIFRVDYNLIEAIYGAKENVINTNLSLDLVMEE